MTLIFTEEELQWIDRKPFAWTVKPGCPQDILRTLTPKLDKLRKDLS